MVKNKMRLNYLPPKKKSQTGRKFENKMYHTAQWRKVRLRLFALNPLCVECLRENKTTIAVVADHIIPVSTGINEVEQQRLMWDFKNLQGLCEKCHNQKSGKESKKNGFNKKN